MIQKFCKSKDLIVSEKFVSDTIEAYSQLRRLSVAEPATTIYLAIEIAYFWQAIVAMRLLLLMVVLPPV